MSQTSRDATFLREVVLDTTRGIVTIDAEGQVVFANEPMGETLGREPTGLVGESITDYLDEGAATLQRIREAAASTDESGRVAATLQTDDVPVAVDLSVDAVNRNGDQYLTLTVGRRTSTLEQRHHEETERLVRQLFERRREALFVFDADDEVIVNCNRQARALLEVEGDSLHTESVPAVVAEPTAFGSFLDSVLADGEGKREEFTWETATGETRPVEVVASPIELDGELLVLAHARDVTDRRQLRAQHRRRTAALDVVRDPIAILDGNREHAHVTDSYASELGYESPTDLEGEPLDRVLATDERYRQVVQPDIEQAGHWQGSLTWSTADGDQRQSGAVIERLADGSLVVALHTAAGIDSASHRTGASDRPTETADQLLSGLNDIRQHLSTADDRESVATACVELLTDVFGFEHGCLRLRTDDSTLETAAMTEAARDLVDGNPGFEFALSEAGRAYRTGDPVVNEGEEGVVTDLLGASAHYPVGDHGVLTVAEASESVVPGPTRAAMEFLAGGVEIALDRIERAQQLQNQRERLRAQQEQLEADVHATELIQEVIDRVVTADTREEIEAMVCSELSAAETYAGAWVVDLDATGDRLELVACDGLSAEDLSSLDDARLTAVADGAIATAVDDETVGHVDTEHLLDPNDSGTADEHLPGGRVSAVPLTHGDRVFGILGVHRATDSPIDERSERSLEVLGDTIGYALSSIENERLLLSDEIVQLEFQVTDPSCLAVALSDELDTYVAMKRTVQNAYDEHLSYVRIEDTAPDRAVDAAESLESVSDCRIINDYEDDCLIEVTRPNSGAEVMMEFGATMRKAEADSGRGTLVLEAPHTVDVRRIVDAYQRYNPQSELLTKRRVDRPVQTAEQLRADIENKLTQKQRSAVSSAYFSGYYEWPRESTAEEIADSMGITASTLHQHLRRAHQKILTSLLETSFSRRL